MIALPYSLRQFATDVDAGAARAGNDAEELSIALGEPIRRLVQRHDLETMGLPRAGNNVTESYYLYYDGAMTVVLFKVPMNPPVQPHDHGTWESLFVYRGEIRHSVYARSDDGSRSGFATLAVQDARILKKGDVVVVAPPRDIHGFHALTEDTWGITVSTGDYKPERLYYQPDLQTYEIRRPRTLR